MLIPPPPLPLCRQEGMGVGLLSEWLQKQHSPLYQSSNLVGTLQLIDSIGLRVEQPSSPCSWRIPWYFSRSLAHTHADIDPTMPNMCTGDFHVLQRLNNSCGIYAIYTVVHCLPPGLPCMNVFFTSQGDILKLGLASSSLSPIFILFHFHLNYTEHLFELLLQL